MADRVKFDVSNPGSRISKHIYGHFSEHLGRCIYDGIWVGRDSKIPNVNGIRMDIAEALKKIRIPVLRWPGGCFADEYHWKDGIGSEGDRKRRLNTHWGMVTESNGFGTHEFFELCELLGCDAYVAGNLGSGTVLEMQDWVDYISCANGTTMSEKRKKNGREEPWKLKFFGIGNENWACGGNMRPEYYADLYRRYQTYVKNYPGNSVLKIACGPNEDNYEWTDTLMRLASKYMWGLSLHYYTLLNMNFSEMGDSDRFGEEEWYKIIRNAFVMDEYIKNHSKIMDRYDPEKKVALVVDEWGTWYKVIEGTNKRFLHQQNTIRDAVSASIHFNIFHQNCERVRMANLAQTVNVLQAVILTYGESMVKTPTYHVFDLYKEHQENMSIQAEYEGSEYRGIPRISATASMDEKNGRIWVSACNIDPIEAVDVLIEFSGIDEVAVTSARILAAPEITSCNTVENPENVSIKEFSGINAMKNTIAFRFPPGSVMTIGIN